VSQDGVASQTDRSAPGKAWRLGLLVVAAGLATGIATQLGQSVLPDGWSQVANAISPWLVVAFLLGSRMPDRRWAALAGIAALVLALVGYYAMIELRYGYGASTSSLLLWGSAAVVGGPVFGIAGWSWRFDDGWHRAAAVGLLAACVIAEGAYLVVILPDPAVGAAFVVVGALVPVVLARSGSDRGRAYVAVIPALALGAVGYLVFIALANLTAGI
jgi:hypothetical protein